MKDLQKMSHAMDGLFSQFDENKAIAQGFLTSADPKAKAKGKGKARAKPKPRLAASEP